MSLRRFKGVKPPGFPTLFEALVNAIACQPISLTAGVHVLNGLGLAFGPAGPKRGVLVYGFPAPQDLSALETRALLSPGLSRQKTLAILEPASAVSWSGAELVSKQPEAEGLVLSGMRRKT
jgi:DNA-3-methyladenine glycosylase II